jgi:hypothetical protein
MAQLILKYDKRNARALNMIKYLSTLSFFKIENKKKSGLEEAIDDVKNGNVDYYENYEAYKLAMNKVLENV